MRVKSDEKRQAIIDAATEVFREVGYERASMSEISKRVGGSKATLYSYFPSKEDLFAAAMTSAVDGQADELLATLDPASPDIKAILRRLGHGYLRVLMSPDVANIQRVAVADGANSGIGVLLYVRGPQRGLNSLTDYMTKLIEAGVLRPCNPRMAAAQLKALFEAGVQEPMLFGAATEFDISEVVDAAVDTFLRAYLAHENGRDEGNR